MLQLGSVSSPVCDMAHQGTINLQAAMPALWTLSCCLQLPTTCAHKQRSR